ncbi:MAG: DMT family transporter [Burkholderiales bacterium]|nr:DMT family transporter [Burkholderiales bacterium]
MTRTRVFLLTALALLAFAANSLFCRAALRDTAIDAASFTTIRLVAGALTLWLIVVLRRGGPALAGDWRSAAALFAYAIAFSLAYRSLTAAAGALLLFGAVQMTMTGYGLWRGERMHLLQWLGLAIALAGLAGLLLPGLSAPPLGGALLMIFAGMAWGMYSLRGRGSGDPISATAGNFVRTVPLALACSLLLLDMARWDAAGAALAVASGALASGIGYTIWYAALPGLKASTAATLQLSVPVIATFGAIVFLDEQLTLRLVLASVAVLGGVALVMLEKKPQPA